MSEHLLWIPFGILVTLLFGVDLILLGKKELHAVSIREAALWVAGWVCLALLFNGLLWWMFNVTQGHVIANAKALDFFTGYLVEWTLSIDNVFVFLLIFNYFAIPPKYQRKVLIYGVVGAIVLRIILILFGSWLIAKSEWVLFLFGLILLIAGVQMLFSQDAKIDLANNRFLKWLYRYLRISETIDSEYFFTRQQGLLYASPLLVVLICLDIADLIFAFDSVPAIFAITLDPLIIITSNVFAIMGLRSLYFLFAKMADSFHLLKYGLAVILLFIAVKIMVRQWMEIPTLLTLAIIIMALGCSMALSGWTAVKSKKL